MVREGEKVLEGQEMGGRRELMEAARSGLSKVEARVQGRPVRELNSCTPSKEGSLWVIRWGRQMGNLKGALRTGLG